MSQRIIALIPVKNEEQSLISCINNIYEAVEMILVLDDSSTDSAVSSISHFPKVKIINHRYKRPKIWNDRLNRLRLLEAGKEYNPDWFLWVDADERFEKRLISQLNSILEEGDKNGTKVCALPYRELWESRRHYRVDGIWGRKIRCKILRNAAGYTFRKWKRYHFVHIPDQIRSREIVVLPFNCYHLGKMTRPQREAKVALYKRIDRFHFFQKIGYDYILDEQELLVEAIEPGREFE